MSELPYLQVIHPNQYNDNVNINITDMNQRDIGTIQFIKCRDNVEIYREVLLVAAR